MRRVIKLPSAAATTLRELADEARAAGVDRNGHIKGGTAASDLLNGYIAKLRLAGWTLQAIADPLGVTRESVRLRYLDASDKAFHSTELPDVPAPPRSRPVRKARKPQMKPAYIAWLLDTYDVAKECRGWHEAGSPERIASEELWRSIDAAAQQGISLASIARELGVSVSAVYQGLRRHGYRKTPPSQSAYLGHPGGMRERKTHCLHGHEFTPENTYVTKNGNRACRECDRRRGRAYSDRKKAERLATVTDLADRRSA